MIKIGHDVCLPDHSEAKVARSGTDDFMARLHRSDAVAYDKGCSQDVPDAASEMYREVTGSTASVDTHKLHVLGAYAIGHLSYLAMLDKDISAVVPEAGRSSVGSGAEFFPAAQVPKEHTSLAIGLAEKPADFSAALSTSRQKAPVAVDGIGGHRHLHGMIRQETEFPRLLKKLTVLSAADGVRLLVRDYFEPLTTADLEGLLLWARTAGHEPVAVVVNGKEVWMKENVHAC